MCIALHGIHMRGSGLCDFSLLFLCSINKRPSELARARWKALFGCASIHSNEQRAQHLIFLSIFLTFDLLSTLVSNAPQADPKGITSSKLFSSCHRAVFTLLIISQRVSTMAEGRETIRWYRAVIDPRLLDSGMPFGTFIRVGPKKDVVDPNTGEVLKRYVPKPLSIKEQAAALQPNYQPNDKINLYIGFEATNPEPSGIWLRMHIPPEACPTEAGDRATAEGVTVKVKMTADNINYLTEKRACNLFTVDGKSAVPDHDIPFIIKNTPKFNEVKNRIIVFDFEIAGGGSMVTEHLFNGLTFSTPYQRGVSALRKIFKRSDKYNLTVFVLDEDRAQALAALRNTLGRFSIECKGGNVYRQFYTQKLQMNNAPHNIDTGTSLKPADERPAISLKVPTTYGSVFEMTTRLGVAVKQALEDRQKRVMDLNTKTATIRLLEILGAGDIAYLGSLRTSANFRLNSGDKVKVNFRLKDPVDDENWSFTVTDPFSWTLQGETMGVLKRPRKPVDMTSRFVNPKVIRPYQQTTLPVQRMFAHNLEDARAALESATPIKVVITLHDSDKFETRLIEAMNICMNGVRNTYTGEGKCVKMATNSAMNWADFMLMKDATPSATHNLISAHIGKEYLKGLTDPDHRACLEYLQKIPVSFNGLTLGMISGVPGSGKSDLAARVIVSRLLADKKARVAIVTTANKPADVLVTKVSAALADARREPKYAELLAGRFVCRAYSDNSEASFIHTLTARNDDEEDDDNDYILEEVTAIVKKDKANAKGLSTEQSQAEVERCWKINSVRKLSAQFCGEADYLANESCKKRAIEDCKKMGIDTGDDTKAGTMDQIPRTLAEAKVFIKELEYEEVDIEEPQFYSSWDGEEGSEKKPKTTKVKRKRLALIENQCIHQNYTAKDSSNAVTISEADLKGTAALKFYGPLLSGGVVDLQHESIPEEAKKHKTAVDIMKQLNRQMERTATRVTDKRYKVTEYSIAQIAVNHLKLDEKWKYLSILLERFATSPDEMVSDDKQDLTKGLNKLICQIKGEVDVIGLTVNALGIPRNRDNIGKFDLVVIDECGMMNLIEFLMVAANLDKCTKFLLLGDSKQLAPQVPMMENSIGFTRELGQSIMEYLEANHWPTASLNLNRRGAPSINEIPSMLYYYGRIKDAPCTQNSHPKTATYTEFFKKLFPGYSGNIPNIYIDVRGEGEIKNEVTGSYVNMSTAAVIVSIVEMGILEKVFAAEDIPHITHYTAQMKVFRHAYAKLAAQFPDAGFENIRIVSTDSIQGDQGSCPFVNTVRTTRLGFTNNMGRNVVAKTRAQDFQVVVDNVHRLGDNGMTRRQPYMRQAFDAAKKKKVYVQVKATGDYGYLMDHRYVHARITGTADN